MNQSTPLYAITGLILGFTITLLVNVSDIQKLEVLKVWGSENYQRLIEIYNTEYYKDIQTQAIAQLETQLKPVSQATSSGGVQ